MDDSKIKNMQSDVLIINESDNVGVAMRELSQGEEVYLFEDKSIRIKNLIPIFHKLALERIELGEPIVKYGEEIGKASSTIEQGDHIHLHNLVCDRGSGVLLKKEG